MKKLFGFMLCCLTLVMAGGCQKQNDGILKVAVSPDYAPYEFMDLSKTGQAKYVGSDIELAQYIATQLNKTLQIEEMSFDACLMAIQTGAVDISISGFSWTPSRDENYELSISYLDGGEGEQQVIILKENASLYTSLDDLNNQQVKVGAQSATIQSELVDSQLPNATKELFTDFDLAVVALINGTIDGLAMAESVAEIRLSRNSELMVVPENFVFQAGNVVVAKKGNTVLMEQINVIIVDVVEQGLYSQWLNAAKALAIQLGEEVFD
ncbi:MAG: transporter substrate-binding domain-containing protein [Bacilli bacterium]